MIVRIVKLSFHTENIKTFEQLFFDSQVTISSFEGCLGVELLNDTVNPNLFFTYSRWENSTALENYRQSDFFKATWAKTKALFNDKPQAWSVSKVNQ